jgi:hypothetical protein
MSSAEAIDLLGGAVRVRTRVRDFWAVERIGCTAGLPFFALRTCSDADILDHRLTVFDRFQSVGAS